MWSHVPLAAMAAKVVGKPVKLVLERSRCSGRWAARPTTVNRIKLGATKDGKLTAMQHDVMMNASVMEDFTEHSAGPTKMLYASANNRCHGEDGGDEPRRGDVSCARRARLRGRRCSRSRWMSWRRS